MAHGPGAHRGPRVRPALPSLPQIPGYPSTQLEIIAPVNLRKALSLKDGDELEVFLD